jgi:arylsulfatase A-like enzyme
VRARLAAALALSLAAACGERAAPPSPAPTAAPTPSFARPNVVLLTIDTLRADHLGLHGYHRKTSPRLDALARDAAVFERAYTYWPKTRGSFVALLTGRRDSQTGYSKTHPVLLGFNPTLAGVLKQAGYRTAAVVDNGNLARDHGYAEGFEHYRETWQEADLETEMDRTRAITAEAVRTLREAGRDRPFFLWLHYVNPHAPYEPPPPFDTAFLDEEARGGPALPLVAGFRGGIPQRWARPGRRTLGFYVAQYDGEIAAVDREVGEVLDALRDSGHAEDTLLVVTSDHGESLGEHDYYFDHGEDLFEPSLRVPLIVRGPGIPRGRRVEALASLLDVVPTVLDAVKVSYPPDLSGKSLLPLATATGELERDRLFARNDRGASATWDARHRLVARPVRGGARFGLYELPAEARDVSAAQPEAARRHRRELELFLERADREWPHARARAGDAPPAAVLTPEACENLKALGYVQHCGR